MLAAVTDEVSKNVTGGRIERISQPEPLDLVLRIYNAGAKHDLLLSCDPDHARVHFTSIRRDNPPQPPVFCMLLRKYLDGARLVAADMPSGLGERIFVLEFRTYDGETMTLVAEIMGRHSNLILVNGTHTILGAAKHIGRDINRFREVLPGVKYQRPPRQLGRRNPLEAYEGDSEEVFDEKTSADWLVATYGGVSPFLAREAVARSKTPYTERSLWYGLNDALTVLRVGDWKPVIWTDDRGATQGAYPILLRTVSEKLQHRRDSISVAIDHASNSVEQRDTFTQARDTLQSALARIQKQRERDLNDIDQGLKNASRAAEYQQNGDMIQASAHDIEKGQTSITSPDYYSETPGATRTIALDPTLSTRENAERYYKKARKARDSVLSLETRRMTVAADVQTIASAQRDLDQATTEEMVEAIHERVGERFSLRESRQNTDKSDRRDAPPPYEGHKIRTFRSADGWEILVGENATANDYLTTKVASSSDIWLHVRAATSAHGVIRAQNRPASVSPAALRHAAELVAARSEIKHSSLIPVDYTLKKYVRKPRKSAPGQVTYNNEKTLYVAGING
ncbi:hypothetical protein CCAX7_42370 [Capsulimonas corticalis]|uniref:NFACT RNA-binding domain-containing protein n=2 Tax=Capsulimonas corticalis TaxID=2219043 RepID=A0A9N7QFA5_9BACT|nr:hypothetical protein CCAX7_42370 [Capsulimonas corticalis]